MHEADGAYKRKGRLLQKPSVKEAELGSSKPSQFPTAFPPFRRSHLHSHTYTTLIHILSHLSAYNTSLQTPTQPFSIPDNGSGRMEQENQEKEPKCSEFVDSDFLDPKDPISQKEIQEVQEIIEGVGDKDMDFTSNKMVLDEIEHRMGIEEMSTQANGFDKEQKLMDELELVVRGTEDLVCDSGLIPLNFGLDEKRNDGCEVGLMAFEDVEFLDSDVNSSGNARDMEEGEISGELGTDGNSFDVSFADALILQQMEVDNVQKPENVTGNMIYPSKIENQEKEKGYDSNSSVLNALQDVNNSGQVESRTSGKKGIACGIEVTISQETIESEKAGTSYFDFLGLIIDHLLQLVNASKKNKRGPGNKEKKKMKYRKKRAEHNRELGVKSLQLQHVQKPKIVSHCLHYLKGRCHEIDGTHHLYPC
ncbi:hypothetical protein CR513_56203, partial [Mucuna pruriens]